MNNFAVVSLDFTHFATSVCVKTMTNTPCHLTLYLSEVKPKRHKDTRTLRGLVIPWGAYFCFVAWTPFDQLEPGDTYSHTHLIPDWLECSTKYFCLKGTIAGIDSPSISPIFEHHNPGGLYNPTLLRPSAPGDDCAPLLDGNGDVCPLHYKNVDDIISDADVTCLIGNTINQWYYWDLYNIPDIPLLVPPISRVVLVARFRRQGGYAYVHLAKLILKTYGTRYESPAISGLTDTYTWSYWTHYVNPFTSLPWTAADINSLQIGVALRKYSGVGWGAIGYCTQLFMEIYFTCG